VRGSLEAVVRDFFFFFFFERQVLLSGGGGGGRSWEGWGNHRQPSGRRERRGRRYAGSRSNTARERDRLAMPYKASGLKGSAFRQETQRRPGAASACPSFRDGLQ